MDIELGNFTITPAVEAEGRLAMMLWGIAGCGKTTLAATAPGKKLWVRFDDQGLDGIPHHLKKDILDLNLSNERNNIIDKFKDDNPLGLDKILSDPEVGIDTVVVDSVTPASQMGLEHMISLGIHKSARLELPGMGSYGGRNALMLRMITTLMRLTGKYKKNIIFIAHEGEPQLNDEGMVTKITMSLGGQLPNLTSLKLGEVWYMQDTGKERKIHLRPFRNFKPMKTRMFKISPDKPAEFVWRYDIDKPDERYTIAHWRKEFLANGKLEIPK